MRLKKSFSKNTETPSRGLSEGAPQATTKNGGGIFVTLPELVALQRYAKALDLFELQRVKTLQSGPVLSPLRGRGIDFAEVRHYQEGDDIRHIDWRVTARSGKTHTKLFQEERERPIFIVVDYGPSLFFGTRIAFKSVIAAKVAALFAFAAHQHGDRVGGLVFSGHSYHEVKPQGGLRGVIGLFKQLIHISEPTTQQVTSKALITNLQRVRRLAKPGSLIIIISDFMDFNPECEQALAELKRHHDMIANFIYDPLEQELPLPGYYTVCDVLAEHHVAFDSGRASIRQAYATSFNDKVTQLVAALRKWRISLLEWRTDIPVTEQVKHCRHNI